MKQAVFLIVDVLRGRWQISFDGSLPPPVPGFSGESTYGTAGCDLLAAGQGKLELMKTAFWRLATGGKLQTGGYEVVSDPAK